MISLACWYQIPFGNPSHCVPKAPCDKARPSVFGNAGEQKPLDHSDKPEGNGNISSENELLENIQSIFFCWPSQQKSNATQGRQTIGKPRSATLEAEKFQEYWTDAPVLRIPGRMFPVWRPVKRLSTSFGPFKEETSLDPREMHRTEKAVRDNESTVLRNAR